MATQPSVTVEDVLRSAGATNIENTSDDLRISSALPQELVSHSMGGESAMQLVSLSDCISTHGAPDFDMVELMRHFATICPDYAEAITQDKIYGNRLC